MMRHFSLRRRSAALALAAAMSLPAVDASSLGPTAAHADVPPGEAVGTLALNCVAGASHTSVTLYAGAAVNVSLNNAACREPAGEFVDLESGPPARVDAVRFAQGGTLCYRRSRLPVTHAPTWSRRTRRNGRQKEVAVCHLADARQGSAVA